MTHQDEQEWEISVSYKCNNCGFYESKTSELLNHTVKVHCDNNFYNCYVCKNFKAQDYSPLKQHLRSRHGIKSNGRIPCPLCFCYSSDCKDELDDHITRDHWLVKAVQSCKICAYKCENNIEDHLNNFHSNFKCRFRQCQLKFDNPLALFSHILSIHFAVLELSLVDDLYFENKNEMMLYLKERKKYGLVPKFSLTIFCNICSNYQSQSRSQYLDHMDAKHPWYRLQCPYKLCTYYSKRFWGFTNHIIYNHLISLSFICPLCAANFSSVNLGKEHCSKEHNKNVYLQKNVACKLCKSKVDAEGIINHIHLNHNVYIPPEIDLLFWTSGSDDDQSTECLGSTFGDHESFSRNWRSGHQDHESDGRDECCIIL